MTPELLSAVLGLFMPIVVEFTKKYTADKRWLNYTVTLVVSVLVGAGSLAVNGQLGSLDVESILGTTGAALVASQAVYNYWFRNSQSAKRISGPKLGRPPKEA